MMIVEGYNLQDLFEGVDGLISFGDDPRKHLPTKGSIVYTIWDKEGRFIYVGISGLQKSFEKRNPQSRMVSHTSGRRSGDQFCIYIHDSFVIPELLKDGSFVPERGALDELTKSHIQANLSYRFLVFDSNDSDAIVRRLEKQIQTGACGIKPLLNGIILSQ
jgi:hypothetical protein